LNDKTHDDKRSSLMQNKHLYTSLTEMKRVSFFARETFRHAHQLKKEIQT